MKKDPNRYTPRPYGHAAPWNRQAPPPPAPVPAPRSTSASVAGRWLWVALAAMVLAGVGWMVYDGAAGL
jgi:hypothetical protein